MKATRAEQEQLLTLQDCDRQLLRIQSVMAKHPRIAHRAQLRERIDDLKRGEVRAQSAVADAKRRAQAAEDKVNQMVNRHRVVTDRLNNGEGSARDLAAIQQELQRMSVRRATLEDEAIHAVEALDAAENELREIRHHIESMTGDLRDVEMHLRRELEDLMAQGAQTQAKRTETASRIRADLLAEYDRCRKVTGGIGVIEVRGRQLSTPTLEPSQATWHDIDMLADDEVLLSDELECIVVKTPVDS